MSPVQLVVGADVGGSSTRVAVAEADGRVRAVRTGGPGNPNGVGAAVSAGLVRDLAVAALADAGAETAAVAAMTIGLAGGTRVIADPAPYLEAATPPGIPVTPTVVYDIAAAYAAGSAVDRGAVLVAGTGSVAALVDVDGDAGQPGRVTTRRGGWGWLLGDEGGGFWLGREAVRLVAARREAEVDPGPLGALVDRHLGVRPGLGVDPLLAAAYRPPPTALAGLAAELGPLSTTDADVDRLLDSAARHLEALVVSLDPPVGVPVVLSGSVLLSPGPVGRAVTDALTRSGRDPRPAAAGVLGAAWLALRSVGVTDHVVHARLTGRSTPAGPDPTAPHAAPPSPGGSG